MKINKNLGMMLLAIYLIVVGAVALFSLTFAFQPIVVGGLAIAAGICVLIGQ